MVHCLVHVVGINLLDYMIKWQMILMIVYKSYMDIKEKYIKYNLVEIQKYYIHLVMITPSDYGVKQILIYGNVFMK
jgi:hypothetical protein